MVGPRRISADCLWPAHALIAELDGARAHATPTRFETDRARDRALQAAGYRTVCLTGRQLQDEREAVARDLRALLKESAPWTPPRTSAPARGTSPADP